MKTILFILFIVPAICRAQDILVKTDKSEVKVKVIEITDAAIKYKKWDNADGPLYNIAKSDVFMIIYTNGQREIIKQTDNSPADASTANSGTSLSHVGSSSALSSINYQANTGAGIDTAVDYKNLKIKYKPSRILYWFEQPATLGIQQEFRIIKNALKIGASTDYFMVEGYSQTLYSVYAAPYIAINRISGNYKNQDKGLFINAKIGYSSLSVSADGKAESAEGVMYGLGADYFITKGLGLSLSGFKFSGSQFNYQAGICFNVL